MFNETEVISRISGLSGKRLKTCVELGWVNVAIGVSGPEFDDMDIARLHLICTMIDDMEVDQDMVPTMLSLIDQLYGLRRQLRGVMHGISLQPANVRKEILTITHTQ